MKEKQISKVMASIENRVRHAYNQGYEQGLKDSKPETCEQIKWERDAAIKQLNELGYGLGEKIKPCEDAISRQAVFNLAKKGMLVSNGNYESVCKAINGLPSVNPQQNIGHWVEEKIYPPLSDAQITVYRCSCCDLHFNCVSNYCPNCGAKDKEDKE